MQANSARAAMRPIILSSLQKNGAFWMVANDLAASGFDTVTPTKMVPEKSNGPRQPKQGHRLPMIKLVVAARRRPDISLDYFYDYWLNSHGPLAVECAPMTRIQRYVQSHPFDSDVMRKFTAGRASDHAPIDGLVEAWWTSEQDMIDAFASPEGQTAGRRLAQDEANFCGAGVQAILTYEYALLDLTTAAK